MTKVNITTRICKYELFSAITHLINQAESEELAIDDAETLEFCARDIRTKLEG